LFQNIFELKKCKETKAEKMEKEIRTKKETEQTGSARGNQPSEQPRKPPRFPLSLSL
jgi:hypothetical protein